MSVFVLLTVTEIISVFK